MQNDPGAANQHKSLPLENWNHYNDRVLGFPTGEHTVEIFMRDPIGELSYISQKFWIQRLDEGINFDIEVSITAGGSPEKLGMDGPEDITCYSLSMHSEGLDAREEYLFETQDKNWIIKLAEQAKSKAQEDGVEYEQKYFRVQNDYY